MYTTEILGTETDEVCQLNTTGIVLAYFSSSVWLSLNLLNQAPYCQIPIPPSSIFVHDCHVQRSILKQRISGHGMTQLYSNPCILPCVKSLESSPLVFLVRFSAPASGSFQFHAMQPQLNLCHNSESSGLHVLLHHRLRSAIQPLQ